MEEENKKAEENEVLEQVTKDYERTIDGVTKLLEQ